MIRLGACFDLSALTPSIVEDGMAVADWSTTSAIAGVFTVDVAIAPDCDAGAASSAYALCSLLVNGCATLRVEITGEGCTLFNYPIMRVKRLRGEWETLRLRMAGDASIEETPCEVTSTLVLEIGENPVDVPVQCGDVILLEYDEPTRSMCPALHIEFAVSLV